MFSRAQVKRILQRVPGKQRLGVYRQEAARDPFPWGTVRLQTAYSTLSAELPLTVVRRASTVTFAAPGSLMMSTVEKPQNDSIREGWKMHQRLNFSRQ
ncbi:uncharacterized protein LOC125158570 isoform X1 [Prionailurus viverrinus]|uniref:uncharacterized protein LOC125158570 isoform X1 n=1 Tax=Prionailurus viverrinus TaxID=61388 RepID=UPI001FF2CA83|nr:uncharacterized protein LOC125158570 isoform X1 [Prionailurus viverrinus]